MWLVERTSISESFRSKNGRTPPITLWLAVWGLMINLSCRERLLLLNHTFTVSFRFISSANNLEREWTWSPIKGTRVSLSDFLGEEERCEWGQKVIERSTTLFRHIIKQYSYRILIDHPTPCALLFRNLINTIPRRNVPFLHRLSVLIILAGFVGLLWIAFWVFVSGPIGLWERWENATPATRIARRNPESMPSIFMRIEFLLVLLPARPSWFRLHQRRRQGRGWDSAWCGRGED